MMTQDELAAKSRQSLPTRSDRIIALAVNVLAVGAIALLALYLGGALATGDTGQAIAFIGLAAVVAAILLAPDVGLLVWIALTPIARLINLSLGRGVPDLGLSRVATMSLLVLLLAQAAVGTRKLARLTAVEGWGIAFAGAMLLSVSASNLGWVAGVQRVFDTIVVPLLCFYFARNLLTRPRHLHWLAVVVALVGAVLGIIAAREQLTGQSVLSPVPYTWSYGQHAIKVVSLFGAPATMAMTIVVPLPLVLVAAMRSRGVLARIFWFGCILAMCAGLLLTYVRAGWLAALLGMLAVVVLTRRFRTFGLALLLIALLAAFAVTQGLIDTRAFEDRLEADQPIAYRTQAISVGLELAARAPILGLGLDNYAGAAAAAGWQPRSGNEALAVAPHNTYIYVLTSAGLLALIPLVAQLAAIGLRGFRLVLGVGDAVPARAAYFRDWGAAVVGMLIAYLVVTNTIDALSSQLANTLFFLCAGAVFAVADTHRMWERRPLATAAVDLG
jgi:O-antigen ligase